MPNAPATFRMYGVKPDGNRSERSVEQCKVYRSTAWKQLRMMVMVRDGMQCQICGVLVTDKGNAHVDHIRPARDASEVMCEPGNLRLLCASCHSKHGRKFNGGGGLNP